MSRAVPSFVQKYLPLKRPVLAMALIAAGYAGEQLASASGSQGAGSVQLLDRPQVQMKLSCLSGFRAKRREQARQASTTARGVWWAVPQRE
jgi:hypothetical protein